jgi:hypothetical protein
MIKGTFTPNDLASANWVHIRPRRSLAMVGLVLIALCFWALWFSFFGPMAAMSQWPGWAILAFFGYVGAWAAFVPYKVRRTFLQRKDLQRECVFSPSEAGLGFNSLDAEVLKPWSDYLKWKEGKGAFLLYLSDSMYQLVPKRFFDSEAEVISFRETLKANVSRHEP